MEWLIFWALCVIFATIIAEAKHRSAGAWFIAGIFFGPFALLVALLPALEDAEITRAREKGESDSYRKCPQCAEVIRREAVKCKHCGSEIEPLPRKLGFLESLGREAGKAFSEGREKKGPP